MRISGGVEVGERHQSIRSGTLKRCDFECGRARWGSVRFQNVAIRGKKKKKCSLDYVYIFFSRPPAFARHREDRTDRNVTCLFHCVASWLSHLAAELWVNFKVILINTSLRREKKRLYKRLDTAARSGRHRIPAFPFISVRGDQTSWTWRSHLHHLWEHRCIHAMNLSDTDSNLSCLCHPHWAAFWLNITG